MSKSSLCIEMQGAKVEVDENNGVSEHEEYGSKVGQTEPAHSAKVIPETASTTKNIPNLQAMQMIRNNQRILNSIQKYKEYSDDSATSIWRLSTVFLSGFSALLVVNVWGGLFIST